MGSSLSLSDLLIGHEPRWSAGRRPGALGSRIERRRAGSRRSGSWTVVTPQASFRSSTNPRAPWTCAAGRALTADGVAAWGQAARTMYHSTV